MIKRKLKLSNIMSQFTKAKVDLESFIEQQDCRIDEISQKVKDLKVEQGHVQHSLNTADKSLVKIKEILGE